MEPIVPDFFPELDDEDVEDLEEAPDNDLDLELGDRPRSGRLVEDLFLGCRDISAAGPRRRRAGVSDRRSNLASVPW